MPKRKRGNPMASGIASGLSSGIKTYTDVKGMQARQQEADAATQRANQEAPVKAMEAKIKEEEFKDKQINRQGTLAAGSQEMQDQVEQDTEGTSVISRGMGTAIQDTADQDIEMAKKMIPHLAHRTAGSFEDHAPLTSFPANFGNKVHYDLPSLRESDNQIYQAAYAMTKDDPEKADKFLNNLKPVMKANRAADSYAIGQVFENHPEHLGEVLKPGESVYIPTAEDKKAYFDKLAIDDPGLAKFSADNIKRSEENIKELNKALENAKPVPVFVDPKTGEITYQITATHAKKDGSIVSIPIGKPYSKTKEQALEEGNKPYSLTPGAVRNIGKKTIAESPYKPTSELGPMEKTNAVLHEDIAKSPKFKTKAEAAQHAKDRSFPEDSYTTVQEDTFSPGTSISLGKVWKNVPIYKGGSGEPKAGGLKSATDTQNDKAQGKPERRTKELPDGTQVEYEKNPKTDKWNPVQ